jgi:hypothetical protein
MKAKEYKLMSECIERGTAFGLSRAYKYYDPPTKEQIQQYVEESVMNEICEYFNFEDDDGNHSL